MMANKLAGSMDLFGYEPTRNILPFDGTVNYYGPILTPGDAVDYQQALLATVPWRHDEIVIYGRHIVTARKVAWYGDIGYSYRYSGTSKTACAWTCELLELKELVQNQTNSTFNSCLLNLYRDGNEGMSWHSDDEKALGKDSTIASLSLGAERKFALRHKRTGETVSVVLEDGSLLLMKGATQTYWQHSLPKSKKITTPRINLTFRTIVPE
jgi:alkylated DNA repair dioxygenase AlkB